MYHELSIMYLYVAELAPSLSWHHGKLQDT